MPNFIDRRLNPKDKSIGNRRRFLKRAQEELKRAVKEHIKTGKIADVEGAHSVPMPSRDTSEPTFRDSSRSGEDRKSTRLNSSHVKISYAVFCLKKKTSRKPSIT